MTIRITAGAMWLASATVIVLGQAQTPASAPAAVAAIPPHRVAGHVAPRPVVPFALFSRSPFLTPEFPCRR